MEAPELEADDTMLQAGSLAFAMLRFAEGAAHPSRSARSPDVPRLGEDEYVFAPLMHRVPRTEVPAFLACLPSPAMLLPTPTRGIVALLLLHELSGERCEAARQEFANQRAGLEDMVGQGGLTADSRILLEFDDEEHVVSLAVLRVWSERFAVHVGWCLSPLENDARASAQLHLFRSDGSTHLRVIPTCSSSRTMFLWPTTPTGTWCLPRCGDTSRES